VVQQDDLYSFERLFKKPVPAADLAKLPKDKQDYAAQILKIGERVSFIVQDAQEGFGHAVWCCKEQVGDEPFMLMLGDHVYVCLRLRTS
jgi:UTP--glucose-1-phosphate uridylyltransferase